jgi:hypothetical protein
MIRCDGLTGEQRRAIEALAQALYEESDPAGVTWAKRPLSVRDAWLLKAQQQLFVKGEKNVDPTEA